MDNIVLITQGSQAISLVRTLFSLGYKPDQILVFTDKDEKNNFWAKNKFVHTSKKKEPIFDEK